MLAQADFDAGRIDRARERFDAALALSRAGGDTVVLAKVLTVAGQQAWARGETALSDTFAAGRGRSASVLVCSTPRGGGTLR